MSLSLLTTRYNWMGYNGTESAESMMLRWAGSQKGLLSQKERFDALQEIEDRLFIIKIEMGLLPIEEIRDIARRRAQAAREEAERLERLRLLHEQELAAQRKALEDEEAVKRREIIQEVLSSMGMSEAQKRECLRAGIELADKAFASKTVAIAVKSFLFSQDASFVSYLDGTSHLSIEELNNYNISNRDRVGREVGKLAVIPSAQSFDTASLKLAQASMNHFRVAYDAFRARGDETFTQRLRSTEVSRLEENARKENGDELLSRLNETQREFETARVTYNRNAAASAATLTLATFSREKERKTASPQKAASPVHTVNSTKEEVHDESERSESEEISESDEEAEHNPQLIEA